ncbi:hypothetical protein [Bradyrhizobium sp. SZCCHNR1085]|uniref:hypothetical protein n=1 Tax=Bradyrhizobium sp. SZCCHNR1085 TaxID=3057365 RepID=UPI002916AA50|nr:hypothetical protein [Bradyrhizobium sp. SZCCHNR1085]
MSWRFLAQNNLKCSEGKGHTFESCRVRHFGMGPGTPKPAVLRGDAAPNVRGHAFDHLFRVHFDSLDSARPPQARR